MYGTLFASTLLFDEKISQSAAETVVQNTFGRPPRQSSEHKMYGYHRIFETGL
jgi:hypothetical protein